MIAGRHFEHGLMLVRIERQADGGWRPVTPSSWPGDRGGWAEFKLVLGRILHAQPPLPLAQWAETATR